MIFSSLHDFLYMQGHGVYVWSAYLVSILLLLVMTFLPLMKKVALVKNIRRRAQFDRESTP